MTESGLEQLWAGWRSAYVREVVDGPPVEPGPSLFDRIRTSDLPDDQTFVLARTAQCFALLNAYPYTSGHHLVVPNRVVADLEALTGDEAAALWGMVRDGVVAVKAAYGCQGVNVGLNLGQAAGAGVPGHLHVHVLPRWVGDTNFTTAAAGVRVLPESLHDSWSRLRETWPAPG